MLYTVCTISVVVCNVAEAILGSIQLASLKQFYEDSFVHKALLPYVLSSCVYNMHHHIDQCETVTRGSSKTQKHTQASQPCGLAIEMHAE